jgi:hypothetical protein
MTAYEFLPLDVVQKRCEYYGRWLPLAMHWGAPVGALTFEYGMSYPEMSRVPDIGANVADPALSQTLTNVDVAAPIRPTRTSCNTYYTAAAPGEFLVLGYRSFLNAEPAA